MKVIGISGASGFVGTHLRNTLSIDKENFKVIEIVKESFKNVNSLFGFVNQCDVVFHFAAVIRHPDDDYIFNENVRLANILVEALNLMSHPVQLIFSSSSQEFTNSSYGKSKKRSREIFEKWSSKTGNYFTALIIPNLFGPFAKPFYNSFVATFSFQLVNGINPTIISDNDVPLLYIDDLTTYLIELIHSSEVSSFKVIPESKVVSVSSILQQLTVFKEEYYIKGIIPNLASSFSIQLFNTFRSYINHETAFPKNYISHNDNRGSFVELIRLGCGGQISFSTTLPDITRGNHFHTRKIERFSVIKGKAKMELRRYGTSLIDTFYLDGDQPSYVDIPIWYYHNITNIGKDVLYTIFWISEQFDQEDSDTYF